MSDELPWSAADEPLVHMADMCAGVGDGPCQPINGPWIAPKAVWLDIARAALDDGSPECRVYAYGLELDLYDDWHSP